MKSDLIIMQVAQFKVFSYVLGYVYTGPVRNGSGPIFGPDRPSVYTGPFWNRSGTDPKLDLLFCRSSIGSDPDRFQKSPV